MVAFNKMFVMIPLMLAARKLDGEDPNVILMLRCAYFTIQSIILGIVVYIYLQASKLIGDPKANRIVYVPPPPQPMADPKEKKYTEKNYGAHVLSMARSLAGSTLFGIAITTGLHFYRGIVMGLAMQTVMGPLGLIESPLVQIYIFGKKEKAFDEKTREELTPEDEIVDDEGKTVTLKEIAPEQPKTFEEVLLDLWDLGEGGDSTVVMKRVTRQNVNIKTKESGWTPIMMMCGLGGYNTVSDIKKMKALGADPSAVDGEGWNALHWAAFHSRPEAAKVLLATGSDDEKALCALKDKEGKTPLDHAEEEGNDEVAKFILKFMEANNVELKVQDVAEEGLRRRKNEEVKVKEEVTEEETEDDKKKES